MNLTSRPVQILTLILSILCCSYWKAVHMFNVYSTKIGGLLSEMLWLPMLILLFGLPVFTFVMWLKSGRRLTSLFFFAFLISILTIVLMVL